MLVQNMKLIHQWQGGLHNHDIGLYTYMFRSCSIIERGGGGEEYIALHFLHQYLNLLKQY